MSAETIQAFVERHHIFVRDVLHLNWSLLRHGVETVLPRYTGNLLAPDDHCLQARKLLDEAVAVASWRHLVPAAEERWNPDKAMQDCISENLGKLVLDRRRPQFPPVFYSSKRCRVGYRKPGDTENRCVLLVSY